MSSKIDFEVISLALALMLLTSCGSGERPRGGSENSLGEHFPVNPKVPGQFDDTSKREAVRSEGQKVTADCISNRTTDNWTYVNYDRRYLCRKPDIYHCSPTKYYLRKEDSSFTLYSKILTKVPASTSPEKAQQMLSQVKSCIPEIKKVFLRYNINLRLDIELFGPQEPGTVHSQEIQLLDEVGRANVVTWYLRGQQNTTGTEFCTTMTHELGHLFSLGDEYEDEDCPEREFTSNELNPVSIMKSPHYDFEYIDFHPRHIQSILAPACYTYATENEWKVPKEFVPSLAQAG